jgi:3-dehydroquinate synthase
MTQVVQVDLGGRSYPIHIGPDLLTRRELYRPHIRGAQVMVVTNETVAPHYLDKVRGALDSYRVEQVILPDGEEFKNLGILDRVFTEAAA